MNDAHDTEENKHLIYRGQKFKKMERDNHL